MMRLCSFGLMVITLLALLLLAAAPAHAQDDPRGWLFVPDLWLSTRIDPLPIVNRAYDMTAIGTGVGWLEGTAWITMDAWSRTVLAAHNYGEFHRLHEIEVGAWIYVADWPHSTTVEGYRVVLMTTTTPDDITWLVPTLEETLTLITCAGARDELRLIVHAERAW